MFLGKKKFAKKKMPKKNMAKKNLQIKLKNGIKNFQKK
jgi:hypothetical protein